MEILLSGYGHGHRHTPRYTHAEVPWTPRPLFLLESGKNKLWGSREGIGGPKCNSFHGSCRETQTGMIVSLDISSLNPSTSFREWYQYEI